MFNVSEHFKPFVEVDERCEVHDCPQLSMATVNDSSLGFQRVYLRHILTSLLFLCDLTGNDLAVCYEIAYDEIKDRKGQLIDGVWVKEADLKPKGLMAWFRSWRK